MQGRVREVEMSVSITDLVLYKGKDYTQAGKLIPTTFFLLLFWWLFFLLQSFKAKAILVLINLNIKTVIAQNTKLFYAIPLAWS